MITNLPWRFVRRLLYYLRRIYFAVPPGRPEFTLHNTSITELHDILRKHHFGNGRLFSYEYKGEDLNMYRAEYVDDEWKDYQTHIRAFIVNTPSGDSHINVDCHFELDPRSDNQAKAHIQEINFSKRKAIPIVENVFEGEELEYKVVTDYG